VSRALAVALVSWLMRLAVGLAFAAILAALLSFAVDGRSWVGSLGVALLIVGSFALLMAFAGHSPGMRLGVQPPYLASMFPGLARQTGDAYPKTRVSESAIFFLTGVTLLVGGLLLV
jgi:hypothetical protein